MNEPDAPELDADVVSSLQRELAVAHAELADARRAAIEAARAATAARELNVSLLAELDDPARHPNFGDLQRRAARLDAIHASFAWRLVTLPRRAVRRVVSGRRR